MKNIVIASGADYRIMYGSELAVLEALPPSIYELHHEEEKGFFLTNVDGAFTISETVYGDVEALTCRVMTSFEKMEGNLGVLFSGPKGLGKTLTVKTICKTALERGLPVIMVKEHFGNIVSFIDTICQPCAVVLDEFEKLYPDRQKTEHDELEGQETLLNMFDSALASRKLFLLTCNDVRNISEYLLNRPGRIHYHFRMNRLSVGEIRAYCADNLTGELHRLIPDICALGTRIPDFSYDMLRSVVFELGTYGCGLEEVKNILNIDAKVRSPFDYKIHFTSGEVESGFDYVNLAESRWNLDWYRASDGGRELAAVNMLEARWSGHDDGSLILGGEHVHWTPQKKHNAAAGIEKIVFTPARKGYLSGERYAD